MRSQPKTMRTKLIDLNNPEASEATLLEAAEIIKKGGTVVFPTETVYGLGANAMDADAVGKIFKAKGRPSDNPLIAHIADLKELDGLVSDVPESARRLAKAFWPGPLTMVFRRRANVPDQLTAGLETVAVRMPSDSAARALIKLSAVPIAAPSANISGRPSPTRAKHVLEDMMGRVDAIILKGDIEYGVESTVVDLTAEPMILRPGVITKEMLESVLQSPVGLSPGITTGAAPERPASPGMKYTHYSPKARTLLVTGEGKEIEAKIRGIVSKGDAKYGVLSSVNSPDVYSSLGVTTLHLGESPLEYAKNLFAALREFDELGVDVILAEAFPITDQTLAVADRLLHACGYEQV